MRILLQRTLNASATVDGEIIGEIGRGLLVFAAVGASDTAETIDRMADKIGRLRVFADESGKTNLAAADVGAEILVVSQFTLYADCRKGNRPSFARAGSADLAEALCDRFADRCARLFRRVERGRFGADMKVSLVNDGPFTIALDSEVLGF